MRSLVPTIQEEGLTPRRRPRRDAASPLGPHRVPGRAVRGLSLG